MHSNDSPRPNENASELAVTDYDRTSAFLLATIILGSVIVLILFTAWLNREPFQSSNFGPRPFPPTGDTNIKVVKLDMILTDAEEFEPAIASNLENVLPAIADTISKIKAHQENQSSNLNIVSDSNGSRETGPRGQKDGHLGSPPPEIIDPPSQRWKINYENTDIEAYCQMLERLKIDIGIVRLKTNDIQRIKFLNGQRLVVNSNRGEEAESLYFQNAKSISHQWDRRIAKSLNLDLENSTSVHFYSQIASEQLQRLERQYLMNAGKDLTNVFRTRFKVVETGAGYQFQIDEILYREE